MMKNAVYFIFIVIYMLMSNYGSVDKPRLTSFPLLNQIIHINTFKKFKDWSEIFCIIK